MTTPPIISTSDQVPYPNYGTATPPVLPVRVERAEPESDNTPVRNPTPTAGKLVLSLILLTPRVGIGAFFLTSALVKGTVSGLAVGAAKTGLLKGKSDAVESFGLHFFRETRRDFSKALMLSLAGILAPIGHFWELWTVKENSDPSVGFEDGHIGSRTPKRLFQALGAGLQEFLYSEKVKTKLKKESPFHTWKKIDNTLVGIADWVTVEWKIQRALKKGQEG